MAMTGYYKTFVRPRAHRPLSMLKYDPVGMCTARLNTWSGELTQHSQEAGAIPRAEERKMRERTTKRSEKITVLRQVSHDRSMERFRSRERSWTLHSAGNIMKGYIYGIRKPLFSASLVHWCRSTTHRLNHCKPEGLPEAIALERGASSSSLALRAELSGKRLVVLFLWPQSVTDSVSHR